MPIHKGLIQVVVFASLFAATTVAPLIAAPAPAGAMQSTPTIPTTQLTDTVYRADGTTATGTVLVSWPAFTTANGLNVPSGNTSVAIATGGTFTLSLVPNAGSNPMGSYYTAIYHLDDGTVSHEYLCGLYSGTVEIGNCLVGYNVRQSSGATVITPMINGVEVGTTFAALPSHTYTLRIRLHCPEMQRLLQTYYATVDSGTAGGVVESFGGGAVTAPATAVFDLLDLGAASNTPAIILYDGSTTAPIASTPAACTFCLANIAQIFGSIGYVRVTQTGSAWAVSTLPSGTPQTRLIGIAGEGADCKISASGKVTFFAGRIPVAGETIFFQYRDRQRAVTRIANATSIASEAASTGTLPGVAKFLGKVLKPLARSSPTAKTPRSPSSASPPAAPPRSPEPTSPSTRSRLALEWGTSGPATSSPSLRTAPR